MQSILKKEDQPCLVVVARRRRAAKEAFLAGPEVNDAAIANLISLHCYLTGAGIGAVPDVYQFTPEAEVFKLVKLPCCKPFNQWQLVIVLVRCWFESDVELAVKGAGHDRVARFPRHHLIIGHFSLHHKHVLTL